MSVRRSAVLMSVALVAAGLAPLVAAPTASAAACGTVESITRDGVPLPTSHVQASCDGGDILWSVWSGPWEDGGSGAGHDLGAGERDHTYVLKLDTGTVIPRVSDTRGANVVVNRTPPTSGDAHWHVTISAKPVLLTEGCDDSKTPWTCPKNPTRQWDGYLGGFLTDYRSWDDTAQRNAFLGMDYSSNIDRGSIPPQIVKDPSSGAQMILLELAAPHETKTGGAFKGNASVVIPNAFLKEVYEVDDPSALTTSGLDPDITGSGSGSVTVADIGGALRVDVTNMSFSKRNVKVHRGTITPTKPTKLAADRLSAGAVKLTYSRSKSRGSKISGYTATCTSKSGPKHVVTVKDRKPATKVSGLNAGTAYTCKVVARSKAGKSGAAKVLVPKRP